MNGNETLDFQRFEAKGFFFLQLNAEPIVIK